MAGADDAKPSATRIQSLPPEAPRCDELVKPDFVIDVCWLIPMRAFRKPPSGQNEHASHAGKQAKSARIGRPPARPRAPARAEKGPILVHAPLRKCLEALHREAPDHIARRIAVTRVTKQTGGPMESCASRAAGVGAITSSGSSPSMGPTCGCPSSSDDHWPCGRRRFAAAALAGYRRTKAGNATRTLE
jgi:hypothetical protein